MWPAQPPICVGICRCAVGRCAGVFGVFWVGENVVIRLGCSCELLLKHGSELQWRARLMRGWTG